MARLTDFDEYGGWAKCWVTTRLQILVQLQCGSMSTIGFGSIEKKVNERQKSDNYQYDLSSNLDLASFQEKFGVKNAYKNKAYK